MSRFGAPVPLLAVVFVDTLGYAAAVPLIPLALLGHGVTPAGVGSVFAAFSLCQLVTAPFLGRLSDRTGRRPVLALSQAGSVLGFLLLALSSSYPAVLISRIIDGSSAGNLAVCYAAVLDSSSEDARRRGIPALGAAGGAGILVGLVLCALLARFGLRAAAGAAALCSLMSLAMTAFAVPETAHAASVDMSVTNALRLGGLRRAGMVVGLCSALQAAFFLTLPAYLATALRLQAQGAMAVIALFVAMAAAFQLGALPRALARLKPRGTAQVLLAVSLGSAAIVALHGAPLPALTAAAVLAVAAAALAPVGALLLAQARPDAPAGLVMGLNASSSTAGQIVGPIAGYAAFGLAGARGLGLSCLALGFCAAVGLGRLGRG